METKNLKKTFPFGMSPLIIELKKSRKAAPKIMGKGLKGALMGAALGKISKKMVEGAAKRKLSW